MSKQKLNEKQPTRTARIRQMLAEGMKPTSIAATLGVTRQTVYQVRYKDKHKTLQEQQKLADVRISKATGLPVRSYRKRGSVKSEEQRLREEIERLTREFNAYKMSVKRPVQVEVPVPQPISQYSFWQRFRILFLGRSM